MIATGAPLRLETVPDLDRLGPNWDALFDAAPDIQCSRAWLGAVAAAALPPGAEPRFLAFSDPDGPVALLPMQAGPGPRWTSLTSPYTCLFQPLLRPGADAALVRRVGAAFGGLCRRWPVTRLEALDPLWPELGPLRAGLHRSGLVSASFAHFANWHDRVPEGGWAAYLAARPGTLRETIRRKSRAAARDPALRLEFVREPASLAPALAAYEAVYARSWKEEEPFGGFNRALFAALAGTAALRVAVMWSGETPIAAQYWTVFRSRATVLKLAYDDAAKAVSPGTVLTAHAIRELIERDGVLELDFGRGDDAYKRSWVGSRRQRIGVAAFNPLRLQGAIGLARHGGGHVFRKAQKLLGRDRGVQGI